MASQKTQAMGSDLDVTKFFTVGLAKFMPTSKSSGTVYAPAQEDSFDLGWLTPNSKLMKKNFTFADGAFQKSTLQFAKRCWR